MRTKKAFNVPDRDPMQVAAMLLETELDARDKKFIMSLIQRPSFEISDLEAKLVYRIYDEVMDKCEVDHKRWQFPIDRPDGV